ncbi:MAG TPA: phosphate ABC transporter permease subunit PstC [Mycobacteriales bacterium]|nr:phosphate ABC transporter permease subunit PstC [Mycobacteriales bacterium]
MTTPTAVAVPPGPGASILRRARPRYGEMVIKGLLATAASLSVLTTVGIIVALMVPTVEFFRTVGVAEFLFGTVWTPLFADQNFGVVPLVAGTLLITVIALTVSIPLGLGAAAYLSEFASTRARKVFKPILELLAGVPTVVYGFFALTFLTPMLRDVWPGDTPPSTFNALSAGLVMGIMIIPTIASLSEDAMSSVPQALRDGAYALGSTSATVTRKVVFPAALSGIAAAIILGISRALGETMIVVVAAGSTPRLTADAREGMQTMTSFIAQAASGDQQVGSIGYNTIFAVGSLLFLFTLLMNLLSIRLVRRFREVYE